MIHRTYFKSEGFMFPIDTFKSNGRIFFRFDFNREIMEEIKSMQGAQYHGFEGAPYVELVESVFGNNVGIWSCKDSTRNRFQLDFLEGKNPFANWDQEIKEHNFKRPLFSHQRDLANHILTVHYGLWSAEMGVGKTLSAIELMERYDKVSEEPIWYVAPKSALRAVDREFSKWELRQNPKVLTYNELVKQMTNWKDGQPAPQVLIIDESQKVKTPTAQRTQAAQALADGIREDHGMDGYVLLMSGSPAPKSPADWWSQCEIAYPGFIKEGNIHKFKQRLGLFEEKDSFAGGTFKARITWLDDSNKCAICGQFENHENHVIGNYKYHEFRESVNEVAKLYRRMKGLVVVKLKKDCLDLPEIQYREIEADTRPSTIRAAKMIAAQGLSAAKTLTLLRELSDGFQYVEEQDGEKQCPDCEDGYVDDFEIKPEYKEVYEETGLPPEDDSVPDDEYQDHYFNTVRVPCPTCAGNRVVAKYSRVVQRVKCPKDDILKDLLDEHEDIGRLVVYAGFTGSVDRCVEIALAEKWAVVKWDGKGIKIFNTEGELKKGDPIEIFQDLKTEWPKVCWVANAAAAGTGLTLTASPTIFYFSNSFNAEDRIQSEARIHRPSMDLNRGATIIDCFHLPTDRYVYKNLKEKRKLQDISMGEIQSIFDEREDGRIF